MLVGRIVRPHGLHGTVVVEAITDRPEARFAPGAVLYVDDGLALTVERFEPTAKSPLLTFVEVSGRDEAEQMRDTFLYIPVEERRDLEEGEFWPDELVGMDVVDRSGSRLGSVTEVETGAGQDRLMIDTGAGMITVPFVTELVPEVDVHVRRIVVVLPQGLTD